VVVVVVVVVVTVVDARAMAGDVVRPALRAMSRFEPLTDWNAD